MEILEDLIEGFSEKIPFLKVFELNVQKLTPESAELTFDMKPDLIGNIINGSLHGGVTATILDSIGGIIAIVNSLAKHNDWSQEAILKQLAKTSTVSLHINYLSLAKGETFRASAKVLQSGNKLFRSAMQCHNEQNILLAEGTATYLVG